MSWLWAIAACSAVAAIVLFWARAQGLRRGGSVWVWLGAIAGAAAAAAAAVGRRRRADPVREQLNERVQTRARIDAAKVELQDEIDAVRDAAANAAAAVDDSPSGDLQDAARRFNDTFGGAP